MITVEQLRAAKFTAILFGDMAKGGYLQVYECKDFPRLSVTVVCEKRGEPEKKRFTVDGNDVADIEAAAAALNEEPAK